MIDDIVAPMLRSDCILFAAIDQEICEISRHDKSCVRINGLKDKVLMFANKSGNYECIGWFRPLTCSDTYTLFFVTLLPDKNLSKTAVMAMAVFSADGELLDIMLKQ